MPDETGRQLHFTVPAGWRTIELDHLTDFGAYIAETFSDTPWADVASGLGSYLQALASSAQDDGILFAGIRDISATTCDCLTLALLGHEHAATAGLPDNEMRCAFGVAAPLDGGAFGVAGEGSAPRSIQYLFRLPNGESAAVTAVSTSVGRMSLLMDEAEAFIDTIALESA